MTRITINTLFNIQNMYKTVQVRYFYILVLHIQIMKTQMILQDMYMPKPPMVCTSAKPVACNECGRGLEAGYGIRAIRINDKNVMLCDLHYPKTSKR